MKLILSKSSLVFRDATMDADALLLMSKYSKTLTTAQQSAVNNLVVALKNAGVYSRLTAAYFPALAGSLSEAFLDAITDTAYDITSQNVYLLDANGLGSAFDSTHKTGVRVDTNLSDSIESIFTSLYEDGNGDSHTSGGINWNCAFSGGYPMVSDLKRRVFTNGSSTTDGALIDSTTFITQTRHYVISWRYTENEAVFSTAHAEICLDGTSLNLTASSESADGAALNNPYSGKISMAANIYFTSSSSSGTTRCAAVLVLGATTTTERDAINTALVAFNSEFWA